MKRYTKFFTIVLVTLIAVVNTVVAQQSFYSYKPYGTWDSPYSWTTVSGGLQYQNEELLYPTMNAATGNIVTISENKSMTFNGSEDVFVKSLDVKGTLVLEGENSINVERLTGKGEIQLKSFSQLKVKAADGTYKPINSFAGTITLVGTVNLNATEANKYNFANIIVKSGETTITGSLTVANNLTIRGLGSLVFANVANNKLVVGGDLTIATGGQLSALGTQDNTLEVRGSLLNNGTIGGFHIDESSIVVNITEEQIRTKYGLTKPTAPKSSQFDLTKGWGSSEWKHNNLANVDKGAIIVVKWYSNWNVSPTAQLKLNIGRDFELLSRNVNTNTYNLEDRITVDDNIAALLRSNKAITENNTRASINSLTIQNYISKSENDAYEAALAQYNTELAAKREIMEGEERQRLLEQMISEAVSSSSYITVEFTGNKDAVFRNVGFAKFYHVRGLKDKGRRIEITNTNSEDALMAVAPTFNVKDYKNLPWSVTSGILSLGDGVVIDTWGVPNKGAHNVWNGNMSDYLKFANVGTSMYIPTGATLEIAGAHVNAGVNGNKSSSVYVAGTLDIKAGSLSTSEYSFGVVLVPAQTAGEVGGNAMPTLKVDGGELNASRIVSYDGTSATLNITDGVVNLDVPNGNIDQGNNCHNRNLALSGNSLFSMTGGEINIKAQFPTGNSKTGINGILLANENQATIKPISFNVTGGSINIRPGSQTNFYLLGLQVKLHNLNILEGVNVAFDVPQNSWTMSRAEASVSLNDLTIDATSSLDASKRNLYISGNVNIATGATISAPGNAEGQNHIVVFTGNSNTTYTYTGTSFAWNDVVLEKAGGATMTVASGSQLRIKGDLTANFGKIAGQVSMCGTADQHIVDESESGLSGVELHVVNNSKEVQLASDAHLKTVVFDVNKRFYLDSYNLKLEDYPTRSTGSWNENSMFWTNNDDGAGGLTLPVPTSLSNTGAITAHIGSCYDGNKYVYTEVYPMYTVPAGQKKYWTVVSVHGLHPVIQGTGVNGTQYEQYFKFTSDVADFSGDTYYCKVKNNYGGLDYRVCTGSISANVVAIDGDAVYNPSGDNETSGFILHANYTFVCKNHTTSDFTLSNISSRSGSSYVSTTSGEWSAKIWKKSNDVSANPTLYNGTEFSTTTNVTIKPGHKITVTSRSNDSKFLKAGKLLIEKGATLEINDKGESVDNKGKKTEYTIINQLDVRVLDGEGTLQYNITDGNSTGYIKGNPSLFYNNKNATVVYNLSCNYTLNMNGDGAYKWNFRDMPNVTIKSSQAGVSHSFRMVTTQGGYQSPATTTIHGSLTVGAGITAQLNSNYSGKLVVEENVNVESSATWTAGSNQEYFVVKKNITNKGTINTTGTVNSFIFYGNITNDGTINLAGVPVSAEGELHSTIKGTSTAKGKTNLGDLHLNKTIGTVGITTQIPLGDATGLCLLKIDRGLFRHAYAGDMITYKGDDCFYIPGDSKFSVDNGTARLYVAEPTSDKCDRVKLSGAIEVAKGATLDNLGGIGYTSGSALTVKGIVSAAFVAPFGGDADIVFKESSGANLNLGPSGNYKTYEDFGVFDIREGSNVSITGGAIDISNTATNTDNATILYHPSVSSFGVNVSMTISTPEGKNCRIDATQALGCLKVNGGADTRVLIENNPLTIGGYLNVVSGKFYCCGNDLNLKQFSKYSLWTAANGYFTVGDIDGNLKDVNTVTVLYVNDNEQKFSLSNTVEFNNLVINAALLTLNRDIVVNGDFRVANGDVQSSKIIYSRGDVYVNQGSSINSTLIMEGTANEQALKNEGEISNLVINNALGINATVQQNYPNTITSELLFRKGNLRIGNNYLDIRESATITDYTGAGDEESFGPNMMIVTNASYTDRGVRLYFNAGQERNMVLPLGDGFKYSPFELNHVVAEAQGNITIRANKGVNSSISNSDLSKTNFLKFFWTVNTSTAFRVTSGSFIMKDDIADAIGLGTTCSLQSDDEHKYVTCVLNNTTGEYDINGGKLGSARLMYSGTQYAYLVLTFDKLTAKDVSGIYTAGCILDLPTDGVGTYRSVMDGNWSGQAIWQKFNRETNSFEGPAIEVPNKNGCKFIVNHNVVLHPGTDPATDPGDSFMNIFMLEIQENGVVDFNATENNNIGSIIGNGKMILRSADVPGADCNEFFAEGGGTIEYSSKDVAVDYNVFLLSPVHNNVIFSGKGKRILPSTNDVIANGEVVASGEVELVLSGQDFFMQKDFTVNNNTVSCTGDGCFIFNGNVPQVMTIPAPMSIAGIGVDNARGLTINNDLTVGSLTLTSGYIKMATDKTLAMESVQSTVKVNNASSFVDGWFSRPVDAAKYITFPVGNANRAASTDIYATAAGVWKVRYTNRKYAADGSDLYNKIMSDLNNSIEGIDNEYWEIDGPANARVRLRWDEASNVTDVSNLRVITQRNASDWKSLTYSKGAYNATSGVLVTSSQSSRVGSTPRVFFFSTSAESASYEWWGGVSSRWDEPGNWSKNAVPSSTSDITIIPLGDDANLLVIDDDIDNGRANAKSIVIENGAKMTLQGAGTILYVEGDVTINTGGQLTLKYDVDANPNFFVKGIVTGKTTVERSIEAGRKYYLGSAVTERNITPGSDWNESYLYIRKYDHPNYKFTNPGMVAGKYSFDRHATYEGEPNSLAESLCTFGIYNLVGSSGHGDVVTGQKYSFFQTGTVSNATKKYTLNAYQGSNWYSNPYPFSLKMTRDAIKVIRPTTGSQIEETVYSYVVVDDQGTFDWKTFNFGIGVGQSSLDALAPFQGFEILCQDGNKVFNNNNVKSQLQLSPVLYSEAPVNLKSAELDPTVGKVLRIFAGNDLSSDELVLLLNDEGSMDRVIGDSEKKPNPAPEVLNGISTNKGDNALVITHMPSVQELIARGITLPINLSKATKADELVLWIKNIEEFDFTGDIYLIDNLTNEKFNFTRDGEYTCTNLDNLYPGRFELSFVPSEENIHLGATAIEETKSDAGRIKIWAESEENARVTIFGDVESNARAIVYDVMGRVVATQTLTNKVSQIAIPSKGMYVVNVVNGNATKSEKLVM